MQEVALILAAVETAQKLNAVVGLAYARIVSGGDFLGTQFHRVVQKRVELDFRIAQHVRIGRAAGLIFAQKFGKNTLLVLFGKVHGFQIDADFFGRTCRIQKVLAARAVFAVIVVFPVFHEYAGDVVSLFLKKPGAHGAVNAAAHAQYHFDCHRTNP